MPGYDLLIVGAGISAATLCALLKDRFRICVLDTRSHLGGNCYDHRSSGTYVHDYGPHIFHTNSAQVVEFLSRYTEWLPYRHSVMAEVEDRGQLTVVPFPYSRATEHALGRTLTHDEILQTFFHGYSEKMWGMPWDKIPNVIKARVPMETGNEPDYFPNQFVAMPKHGYTRMLENMFDGVELVLRAGPHDWHYIPAKRVVYCGRPDLIRPPQENGTSYGEKYGLTLRFRSLDMHYSIVADWGHNAPILNACSTARKWTRRVRYSLLTGGQSLLVGQETPYEADARELSPFYPVPLDYERHKYRTLSALLERDYPNLLLCGRLGTYKYLDMHQAVAQAQVLAVRLRNEMAS